MIWSLIYIFPLFLGIVAASSYDHVEIDHHHGHRTCTVKPRGGNLTDVPNIVRAFEHCGKGGRIVFPKDKNYWIAEKLHVHLENAVVDWEGEWTYSPDMDHWRNNSYFIEFQNHRAAFIISGRNFTVDGHGTGGIYGNGDVWYDFDQGPPSSEGRPMPFVLWNVTDSAVNNFYIRQSQFWTYNVMNGTNLTFENITANSLAVNGPGDENWNQNVDGFNTMDCDNITLKNFDYHGGDDCIAIKPRSFNIHIDNITCEGGNGVAIGSLGQYLEDNSVENVTISNAKLTRYAWSMHSVYIKTWMGHLVDQGYEGDGYESGGVPRGGGWGHVRNLTFSNFELHNVNYGPNINQNSGVKDSGFEGTSKILVSEVWFRNFTGTLKDGARLGDLSCSEVYPCRDIYFEEMGGLNATEGRCKWAVKEAIFGLPGCSADDLCFYLPLQSRCVQCSR